VSEHAKLSPSSSAGWLACAGRIALEAAYPNTSSEASDKGTACHAVAAKCLTEANWTAEQSIGTKVPVHSPGELTRVVLFTDEMAAMVQPYVDTMRGIGRDHVMLIEHRVDFSDYIGVPESFGTADCIILLPLDSGGHELLVADFKTGWVRVSPENNTQGMLYALGALREFEMSHDIKQVRVAIFQPAHGGLSEWVVPVGDMP
jgi:hypothetical protein